MGVSLSFLQRFAADVPRGTTTAGVVQHFVRARTRPWGCRYIEVVPPQCLRTAPKYFISHMWAMDFHRLVDSVSRHLAGVATQGNKSGAAPAGGAGGAGGSGKEADGHGGDGGATYTTGGGGGGGNGGQELQDTSAGIWLDIFAINQVRRAQCWSRGGSLWAAGATLPQLTPTLAQGSVYT